MKQVAFRLDQKMIDKVAERIERDGITLSTFMRKALKDALEHDPGLQLPALKSIVLREAEEPQLLAVRDALLDVPGEALERFFGSFDEPAISGAPPSRGDLRVDMQVSFIRDGKPPTRIVTADQTATVGEAPKQ